MSKNNKPSVRPKRRNETASTSVDRPHTVSKDAALARQLMQEDIESACAQDEQLAKELQSQLDEITDQETARQFEHENERKRPSRVTFNPNRHRNPFLRTGLRPLSERFQEINIPRDVDDMDESDDNLLDAIRISERINNTSDNSENQRRPPGPAVHVYDSSERTQRPLRSNGWLSQRQRNTNNRSALNSQNTPHSVSGNTDSRTSFPNVHNNNVPSRRTTTVVNSAPRRAPFPQGMRHRSVRPTQSNDGLSASGEGNLDTDIVQLNDRFSSNPAASGTSTVSEELEPEELLMNFAMDDGEFINILRDPMMLIAMLMSRAPSLLVPDNVDLNDYDALWDLAERNGEVKNKGLTEEEIEKLPVKLHTLKNRSKHAADCRICLTEYQAGEKIRELPCNHVFHRECVDEWLKRNSSCPICREEIKPT